MFRVVWDDEVTDWLRGLVEETGVEIDLIEVTDHSNSEVDGRYGVTPDQHEALMLAVDRGYFESPREVTLEELADELDISRQAFAGRLRRGHRNLVRHTIGGRR